MPCVSRQLEPDEKEYASKLVAGYLVWLAARYGRLNPLPEYVVKAAKDVYGNPRMLDEMTAMLCEFLGGLSAAQIETISRKVPTGTEIRLWWHRHQQADAERRAMEVLIEEERRAQETQNELRNTAIEKAKKFLSEEELRALLNK